MTYNILTKFQLIILVFKYFNKISIFYSLCELGVESSNPVTCIKICENKNDLEDLLLVLCYFDHNERVSSTSYNSKMCVKPFTGI